MLVDGRWELVDGEKDSSERESGLPRTPGINLATESTIAIAGISPPVKI